MTHCVRKKAFSRRFVGVYRTSPNPQLGRHQGEAFRALCTRIKLLKRVGQIRARKSKDVVEKVAIAREDAMKEIEHRPSGQKLAILQVSMQQNIQNLLTNFRHLQQIDVSRELRLTIRSLIGNEERIVGLRSDQPFPTAKLPPA